VWVVLAHSGMLLNMPLSTTNRFWWGQWEGDNLTTKHILHLKRGKKKLQGYHQTLYSIVYQTSLDPIIRPTALVYIYYESL
jgi:hypothetical protein